MTVPLPDQAARAEKLLERVAPKLLLVEDELRRHFNSPIRTIREVGDHLLAGGGKRLRPAVLLIVADMLGYDGYRDVTYGAVVELIHNATLIHDDVIDEAALRRGRESVNRGWGNQLSVLVGDYIFMHSMNIALADGNLEVLRLLSDATIRMIEGEILGNEQNGRTDLTLDEYFEVVSRKTAALFGACCRIPASFVNLPENQAQRLYEYGVNLGICFQLIDDLLDFTSSTEVLGKPALSDLKEGKITLPLILAMPRATAAERSVISRVASERSFDRHDPAEVLAIVNRYDTVEQTRGYARDYARGALTALNGFPKSPARDALEVALEFVMERDR